MLRWATWNLWAVGPEWVRRLDAACTELVRTAPDVVCLQEVRCGGGVDAAEELAAATGLVAVRSAPLGSVWWSDRVSSPITVENVVLSRWPAVDVHLDELPVAPGAAEVRTALQARIESPDGPVRVVSTQLSSSPLDSARRVEQVRAVATSLGSRRAGDETTLVAGDLNAEPDSDEVRLLCGHKTTPVVEGFVLMDLWRFADGGGPGWTWDRANPHVRATREPSCRIDALLAGPTPTGPLPEVHAVGLMGDRDVDGVWASDHAGVVADISL